jgi:hypothetical protein
MSSGESCTLCGEVTAQTRCNMGAGLAVRRIPMGGIIAIVLHPSVLSSSIALLPIAVSRVKLTSRVGTDEQMLTVSADAITGHGIVSAGRAATDA